jgi:hypothetical protein
MRKSLNILGYTIDTDFSRSSDELGDVVGRCSPDMLYIRIASDMPYQSKISGMVHEIIEVINSQLQLNLEHETICRLETSLFQTLTMNGVDLSPLIEGKGEKYG